MAPPCLHLQAKPCGQALRGDPDLTHCHGAASVNREVRRARRLRGRLDPGAGAPCSGRGGRGWSAWIAWADTEAWSADQPGVTRVVMEATGDYWRPPFYLLENTFETWLVNAKDVRHLPGRPKNRPVNRTTRPDSRVGPTVGATGDDAAWPGPAAPRDHQPDKNHHGDRCDDNTGRTRPSGNPTHGRRNGPLWSTAALALPSTAHLHNNPVVHR